MPRPSTDTSVFLAIADPTRRAMLEALLTGDRAAGDFCEMFSAGQSTLSGHLAVLRRAGLVRVRRDGRRMIYRITPTELRSVADWVAHFDHFWTQRLEGLGAYLDRAHPQAGEMPDITGRANPARRGGTRGRAPGDASDAPDDRPVPGPASKRQGGSRTGGRRRSSP